VGIKWGIWQKRIFRVGKIVSGINEKIKPQLVIPGHGGERFHFSAELLPNTLKVVKETIKQ
jgi:hypothetical protein